MRVGVDATSWVNARGYGRFVRNVVGRLVEMDTDTRYVLYIDGQSADAAQLPPGAERRVVTLRHAPSQAAAADGARGLGDLLRLTRSVTRDAPDVFLFPSLYTFFPVVRCRTVVGVHDVIAERAPELTLPTRRARLLWTTKRRMALRVANRVFTVSETSRRALAETFGLDPAGIPVVPEAPDPVFTPRGEQEAAVALLSVGVPAGERPFVYAAGISPHKNIETLLDAYAVLRARRRGAPALVLAGSLDGDAYLSSAASVRNHISRLGLGDHVCLPGFVPDETLAALYSAACAAVVPSLDEGFGLPAVEAAACGAPVVLSDLPAHRESLGDAALYFGATEADELAAHLEALSLDPALRAHRGRMARTATGRLSWDVSAERLADVIAACAP